MSLIRFDSSDSRAPSESAFHGLVDWVKGSLSADLGNCDFDDYAPHNAGNHTLDGTSGFAFTLQDLRDGVLGVGKLTATAGSNACAVAFRNNVTKLSLVDVAVIGARIKEGSGDDAVQWFLGLTDQTTDGGVFTSSALTVGGSEDHLGFRRNIDGSVDVVAVVAGATAVELISDVIVAGTATSAAYVTLELRIQQQTPSLYRLIAFINGVQKGAVNVASTALSSGVFLRPVVAVNHTDNAATPNTLVDWTAFFDK